MIVIKILPQNYKNDRYVKQKTENLYQALNEQDIKYIIKYHIQNNHSISITNQIISDREILF